MTDDARIARLTELARKMWPDAVIDASDPVNVKVHGAVERSGGRAEWIERIYIGHPRALDALEAALRELAKPDGSALPEVIDEIRAEFRAEGRRIAPLKLADRPQEWWLAQAEKRGRSRSRRRLPRRPLPAGSQRRTRAHG